MKTKKILLVEDEQVIQRLVQRVMAPTPFDVEAVDSVVEAGDRIEAGAYHLLVTDLRLPDGEGAQVIDRFRRRFPSSKVIVITGSLMPESLLPGIPVESLAGCLVKPFDIADFSAAVSAAIGGLPAKQNSRLNSAA